MLRDVLGDARLPFCEATLKSKFPRFFPVASAKDICGDFTMPSVVPWGLIGQANAGDARISAAANALRSIKVDGIYGIVGSGNLISHPTADTETASNNRLSGLAPGGTRPLWNSIPWHTTGDVGQPVTLFSKAVPSTTLPQLKIKLAAQQNEGVEAEHVNSGSECAQLICLIAHQDEELARPGAAFGTAFSIGNGWFLTPHHVLPDLESLRHMAAYFLESDGRFEKKHLTYERSSFIASEDGIRAEDGDKYLFDYAVFQVKDAPSPAALACRSAEHLHTKDILDLLRPLRKVSNGEAPVTGLGIVRTSSSTDASDVLDALLEKRGTLLFHRCSTWGGDSGDPIVDKDGYVVGMHTHESPPTAPVEQPPTSPVYGWGTRIDAIARDIEQRAPTIFRECFGLHGLND